jgi:hypothetical protein
MNGGDEAEPEATQIEAEAETQVVLVVLIQHWNLVDQ